MAITLKNVILPHQKKEDGTYNVKIRVTLNRKTSYISTEHYVSDTQISSNYKIKDENIIDILNVDLANLRKEVSRIGARVNNYEVKDFCEYLQSVRNPNNKSDDIDFFQFAESIIHKMKESRRDSYRIYQGCLNNLRNYHNKKKLSIYEVTARFLRRYETHLKSLPNMGSRGLESNMATIRSIFNQARREYNDEDMGIIRISHYPFNSYKIPKSDIPKQRSLEAKDIINIFKYEYEVRSKHAVKPTFPLAELARDVYMLSFYLVGMNSKDLYNVERIDRSGRITYKRAKTKDRRQDKAEISIKVPKEAFELIEKYKDKSKKRLFNFYQRYSTPQGFNCAVNKGLKVIGETIGIYNLDFYSARHSWATIARNDCDVSVDDIGLSLNHSTASRVTDRYIRKDWSRIDKANDKVIDFINRAKEDNV